MKRMIPLLFASGCSIAILHGGPPTCSTSHAPVIVDLAVAAGSALAGYTVGRSVSCFADDGDSCQGDSNVGTAAAVLFALPAVISAIYGESQISQCREATVVFDREQAAEDRWDLDQQQGLLGNAGHFCRAESFEARESGTCAAGSLCVDGECQADPKIGDRCRVHHEVSWDVLGCGPSLACNAHGICVAKP